jgi:septal ring factor EnvC (AmiA/AmiB activator)
VKPRQYGDHYGHMGSQAMRDQETQNRLMSAIEALKAKLHVQEEENKKLREQIASLMEQINSLRSSLDMYTYYNGM